MQLIPAEELSYFENMIYLPMIISILERDREVIETSSFKLKGPYIYIVETTLKTVRDELKEIKNYARSNNMKMIKRGKDCTFTEYAFIHNGYEDKRRYMNIRLRNRTEELIGLYFAKVENQSTRGVATT